MPQLATTPLVLRQHAVSGPAVSTIKEILTQSVEGAMVWSSDLVIKLLFSLQYHQMLHLSKSDRDLVTVVNVALNIVAYSPSEKNSRAVHERFIESELRGTDELAIQVSTRALVDAENDFAATQKRLERKQLADKAAWHDSQLHGPTATSASRAVRSIAHHAVEAVTLELVGDLEQDVQVNPAYVHSDLMAKLFDSDTNKKRPRSPSMEGEQAPPPAQPRIDTALLIADANRQIFCAAATHNEGLPHIVAAAAASLSPEASRELAEQIPLPYTLLDSNGREYHRGDFSGFEHTLVYEDLIGLATAAAKAQTTDNSLRLHLLRKIAATLDIASQVDDYRRDNTTPHAINEIAGCQLCPDYQFGCCKGSTTGTCPDGKLHRCWWCLGTHQGCADVATGGFIPFDHETVPNDCSHSKHSQAGCHHKFTATLYGQAQPVSHFEARMFGGTDQASTEFYKQVAASAAPRCSTESGPTIMDAIHEACKTQDRSSLKHVPALVDQVQRPGLNDMRVSTMMEKAAAMQATMQSFTQTKRWPTQATVSTESGCHCGAVGQNPSTACDCAAASKLAPPPAAHSEPKANTPHEHPALNATSDPFAAGVKNLVAMGFPENRAAEMLHLTEGNVESAVTLLSSKPPPPPEEEAPAVPAAPAPPAPIEAELKSMEDGHRAQLKLMASAPSPDHPLQPTTWTGKKARAHKASASGATTTAAEHVLRGVTRNAEVSARFQNKFLASGTRAHTGSCVHDPRPTASDAALHANSGSHSVMEPNVYFLRMTVLNVSYWLASLQLSEYTETFREQGVDGEALSMIDSHSLKHELGVAKIGHRIKLIKAIALLAEDGPVGQMVQLPDGTISPLQSTRTAHLPKDSPLYSSGEEYARLSRTIDNGFFDTNRPAWLNKIHEPASTSDSSTNAPRRNGAQLLESVKGTHPTSWEDQMDHIDLATLNDYVEGLKNKPKSSELFVDQEPTIAIHAQPGLFLSTILGDQRKPWMLPVFLDRPEADAKEAPPPIDSMCEQCKKPIGLEECTKHSGKYKKRCMECHQKQVRGNNGGELSEPSLWDKLQVTQEQASSTVQDYQRPEPPPMDWSKARQLAIKSLVMQTCFTIDMYYRKHTTILEVIDAHGLGAFTSATIVKLWLTTANHKGEFGLQHMRDQVQYVFDILDIPFQPAVNAEPILTALFGPTPAQPSSAIDVFKDVSFDVPKLGQVFRAISEFEAEYAEILAPPDRAHGSQLQQPPWMYAAPAHKLERESTYVPHASTCIFYHAAAGSLGFLSNSYKLQQSMPAKARIPGTKPLIDQDKPVTLDSAAHAFKYMHAATHHDDVTAAAIQHSKSPTEWNSLASNVTGFQTAYWEEVKIESMVECLLSKFEDRSLRAKLFTIKPGAMTYVYADPADSWWGIELSHEDACTAQLNEARGGKSFSRLQGYHWKGANVLGKCLTIADYILRKAFPDDNALSPALNNVKQAPWYTAPNSKDVPIGGAPGLPGAESASAPASAPAPTGKVGHLLKAGLLLPHHKSTSAQAGGAATLVPVPNAAAARAVQLGLESAENTIDRSLQLTKDALQASATADLPPGVNPLAVMPAKTKSPSERRREDVQQQRAKAISTANISAAALSLASQATAGPLTLARLQSFDNDHGRGEPCSEPGCTNSTAGAKGAFGNYDHTCRTCASKAMQSQPQRSPRVCSVCKAGKHCDEHTDFGDVDPLDYAVGLSERTEAENNVSTRLVSNVSGVLTPSTARIGMAVYVPENWNVAVPSPGEESQLQFGLTAEPKPYGAARLIGWVTKSKLKKVCGQFAKEEHEFRRWCHVQFTNEPDMPKQVLMMRHVFTYEPPRLEVSPQLPAVHSPSPPAPEVLSPSAAINGNGDKRGAADNATPQPSANSARASGARKEHQSPNWLCEVCHPYMPGQCKCDVPSAPELLATLRVQKPKAAHTRPIRERLQQELEAMPSYRRFNELECPTPPDITFDIKTGADCAYLSSEGRYIHVRVCAPSPGTIQQHVLETIQGAFVLVKVIDNGAISWEHVSRLREYVEDLIGTKHGVPITQLRHEDFSCELLPSCAVCNCADRMQEAFSVPARLSGSLRSLNRTPLLTPAMNDLCRLVHTTLREQQPDLDEVTGMPFSQLMVEVLRGVPQSKAPDYLADAAAFQDIIDDAVLKLVPAMPDVPDDEALASSLASPDQTTPTAAVEPASVPHKAESAPAASPPAPTAPEGPWGTAPSILQQIKRDVAALKAAKGNSPSPRMTLIEEPNVPAAKRSHDEMEATAVTQPASYSMERLREQARQSVAQLNASAADSAAPSTPGRTRLGDQAQQPAVDQPAWFGRGLPRHNLSMLGKGVNPMPSPPSATPAEADAMIESFGMMPPEHSLILPAPPPSSAFVMNKKMEHDLGKCTSLFAGEDGYWRPCLLHADLGAEFVKNLSSHEVIISFPKHFEQQHPELFADDGGHMASLYRSAVVCVVKRDERENTPHNRNSPTKRANRPNHVAARNKRALVRLTGQSVRSMTKPDTPSLFGPNKKQCVPRRFELMAITSVGKWAPCTANISTKRLAKAGVLPAGHMWIRWSNHVVKAWPVAQVSDMDSKMLGLSHNPAGTHQPILH